MGFLAKAFLYANIARRIKKASISLSKTEFYAHNGDFVGIS